MNGILKFCFGIILLLFMRTALSAVCTGTLTVSAKVIPVCVVKPGTMSLQAYKTGKCSEVRGVCRFDIVCTNGLNASILANKGEHSAYAGVTTRALSCDQSYISYDLYVDSACQNIWDENYTLLYSSKTGLPYSMVVYGKAYINPDAHPGMYKDKIIIRPSCPGANITPAILDVNLIVY